MASKYWIKLYHEVLDDPKMGRLPDSVWRRCIEIFLIAGETNNDGFLPPVGDMAWRLRLTDGEMLSDLDQLSKVGIVEETEGGWFVIAFKKRQSKMSKAEYMRRLREERAGMLPDSDESVTASYQSVTNGNADTDKEEDTDIDIDKELEEEGSSPSLSSVFKSVHNCIGGMNLELSQMVESAYDEYGGQWVLDAVKESVRNGVYKWNYTEAILRNWKRSGRQTTNSRMNNTITQATDNVGGVYV